MGDQDRGRVQVALPQPGGDRAGLGVALLPGLEEGVQAGQLLELAETEQAGGLQAAAPLAGEDLGGGDAVGAEALADPLRLSAPLIGQVPLGRAVSQREVAGIARPGRQGVAHHRDVSAGLQRPPEVRFVERQGRGRVPQDEQDQRRERLQGRASHPHQPRVPGGPLKGPTMRDVIQPP